MPDKVPYRCGLSVAYTSRYRFPAILFLVVPAELLSKRFRIVSIVHQIVNLLYFQRRYYCNGQLAFELTSEVTPQFAYLPP
jgi:hypothetical protein